MNYTVNIEKIPKVLQEAYGAAHKQLTLWEGEARKVLSGTYTKIRQNPSVQKMGSAMDQWRTRSNQWIDLEPIRKQVVKLRTDLGNRAAATIGIATKTDIRSITTRINKLKNEVRKLATGGRKNQGTAVS